MLNIVICDDEVIDRKLIKTMVDKYIEANHVEAETVLFESGDEYLSEGNIENADIVFLDIYMEGTNGVELARRIRGQNRNCQIIFTTSSNEYASDAFEVEAISYLRKPVNEEKLKSVLDMIMDRRAQTSSIEISCERTTVRIYVSDIIFIETLGRRVLIHTVSSVYSTYMTLAKMVELIPPDEFVQVSRFEIISLRHVVQIGVKEVALDDGKTIQVSQRMLENLSDRYDNFRKRIK